MNKSLTIVFIIISFLSILFIPIGIYLSFKLFIKEKEEERDNGDRKAIIYDIKANGSTNNNASNNKKSKSKREKLGDTCLMEGSLKHGKESLLPMDYLRQQVNSEEEEEQKYLFYLNDEVEGNIKRAFHDCVAYQLTSTTPKCSRSVTLSLKEREVLRKKCNSFNQALTTSVSSNTNGSCLSSSSSSAIVKNKLREENQDTYHDAYQGSYQGYTTNREIEGTKEIESYLHTRNGSYFSDDILVIDFESPSIAGSYSVENLMDPRNFAYRLGSSDEEEEDEEVALKKSLEEKKAIINFNSENQRFSLQSTISITEQDENTYDSDDYFFDDFESIIGSSSFTTLEEKEENVDFLRMKVIHEIIKTEKNYLEGIEILQKFYIDPLLEEQKKSTIVPKEFCQVLFKELRIIYKINSLFYSKIELYDKEIPTESSEKVIEFCKDNNNLIIEQGITNEILKLCSTLKLYSGYIAAYQTALNQMREEQNRNKRFKMFVKKVQEEMIKNKIKTVNLLSYFITPIQRIPRYQLLLDQLVKYSSHLDNLHKLYTEASDTIKKVAEYCNEKERELQNTTKVLALANKLKLKKLIHPARKFLLEADLIRIKQQKEKGCKLYVFNDLILITKERLRTLTKVLSFNDETLRIINQTNTVTIKQKDEVVIVLKKDNKNFFDSLFQFWSSKVITEV